MELRLSTLACCSLLDRIWELSTSYHAHGNNQSNHLMSLYLNIEVCNVQYIQVDYVLNSQYYRRHSSEVYCLVQETMHF